MLAQKPLPRGASTERVRPRVAVTMGDPNGIGPEVVLKCLADERLRQHLRPVVVGSSRVLEKHAQAIGLPDLRLNPVTSLPEDDEDEEDGITVLEVSGVEVPEVVFGQISADAGRLSMRAVQQAVDLCQSGEVEAMVTAPISKEAISLGGIKNTPGHTEFIARRVGSERYLMMMIAEDFRVGLLTTHVSIWDVPKRVKQDAIVDKLALMHDALVQDFGIPRPRIAVLGLNPHASDGGLMGREEDADIIPAIKQACDEGLLTFGPFPSDGFFAIGGYRAYDAVLAMYHDQGLIPFKMVAFDHGVNYTAGLPIVRTSPDHGTAYDIAGQGKAIPGSMLRALFLATDVARRRAVLAAST